MKVQRVVALTLVIAALAVVALSRTGADWRRLLRRSPFESVDITIPAIQGVVAGEKCSFESYDGAVSSCAYLLAVQSITATNARPSTTRWSGTYQRGDGYTSYRLTLGEDDRVITRVEFDFGAADTWFGFLQRERSRFGLNLVDQSRPGHLRLQWNEYFFVPWGERRYLIATDELDAFVNAVNRDDVIDGRFLVHVGDEKAPVCDRPELPPPWREHLRDTAQQGRILAVTRTRPKERPARSNPTGPPPPPPSQYLYRVRMQAGQAEGVFVGQYFGWSDSKDNQLGGNVVSLDEHEAVLEVETWPYAPRPGFEPKIGMLLVSSPNAPSFVACH